MISGPRRGTLASRSITAKFSWTRSIRVLMYVKSKGLETITKHYLLYKMDEHTMLDSLYWHIRSWDEIERTSLFTLSNYVTIFLLLLFTVIAIIQTRSKIVRFLSL